MRRRNRRTSGLLPLFLLIVIGLAQFGYAAGHGAGLQRGHNRSRRWKTEDRLEKRQLAAGFDALGDNAGVAVQGVPHDTTSSSMSDSQDPPFVSASDADILASIVAPPTSTTTIVSFDTTTTSTTLPVDSATLSSSSTNEPAISTPSSGSIDSFAASSGPSPMAGSTFTSGSTIDPSSSSVADINAASPAISSIESRSNPSSVATSYSSSTSSLSSNTPALPQITSSSLSSNNVEPSVSASSITSTSTVTDVVTSTTLTVVASSSLNSDSSGAVSGSDNYGSPMASVTVDATSTTTIEGTTSDSPTDSSVVNTAIPSATSTTDGEAAGTSAAAGSTDVTDGISSGAAITTISVTASAASSSVSSTPAGAGVTGGSSGGSDVVASGSGVPDETLNGSTVTIPPPAVTATSPPNAAASSAYIASVVTENTFKSAAVTQDPPASDQNAVFSSATTSPPPPVIVPSTTTASPVMSSEQTTLAEPSALPSSPVNSGGVAVSSGSAGGVVTDGAPSSLAVPTGSATAGLNAPSSPVMSAPLNTDYTLTEGQTSSHTQSGDIAAAPSSGSAGTEAEANTAPGSAGSSAAAVATQSPSGAGAAASNSDKLSLMSMASAPVVSGSQVMTFSASATAPNDDSATSSDTPSYTTNNAYTPSQTFLIVATTGTSSANTATVAPTTSSTGSATRTSVTASLPSTASIPSSVPTIIVPADSVANQANAGTGNSDDPLKDDTLIALLLASAQYPWTFVVNSSDATSQLFNTFPELISSALNINTTQVRTYGLMVYQPASWNGDEASLLTQWLAYIPSEYFSTLNAYVKTQSSPLYNQTGMSGQLAAQINTAFPLAATAATATTSTTPSSTKSSSTRTRDIIIGVCVGLGGLLWLALVVWVYKRIKRSNERAVHTRLSEHMSMFSGHQGPGYGARDNIRRASNAPSLAPSEVDDRPSSFYASPLDNDRFGRQEQGARGSTGDESFYSHPSSAAAEGGHESPTTYGPSVFGASWFANPQPAQPVPQMRQARVSQNPFEDIVTKSYLTTSGSSNGLANIAQRRSAMPKPVQKGMISQPTLQTNSLEFREY